MTSSARKRIVRSRLRRRLAAKRFYFWAAIAAVPLLAACGTAAGTAAAGHSPAPSSSPRATASPSQPAPSSTRPVTTQPTAPPATGPPATASPAPPATVVVPNVTDPWAVVSAYYGDVESGNYPEAWALLSSGSVTGQTYQQFVAGYSCTGSQVVSELSESGDQVSFDLSATNSCTGAVQDYTGTNTVVNGKIVAADITPSG